MKLTQTVVLLSVVMLPLRAEASWFEYAAGPRILRLAWVIAAGAATYFAALALMGFRLRDFARHE